MLHILRERREKMAVFSGVERRQHARLYVPFPVLVRGVEASGATFRIHTVLDDFSGGGLHVRLPWRVEPGTKLFAEVRMTTATDPAASAPCVAVLGEARRVEPQPDGRYGVGMQFTQHRFL